MAILDNLVSYWRLDEANGNASDVHGSKTLTNNNTVGYSAGKFNNSADFGATNANKSLSTTTELLASFDSAHSYAFWVNVTTQPTSGGNQMYFFFNDMADGNTRIAYQNESDTLKLIMQRGSSDFANQAENNYTLTTGTWFHIVFTYAGTGTGTGKLYVNGVLQGTTLTSTATTGTGIGPEFAIGLRKSDGSNPFSGKIDEFGFWGRELTAAEASDLYNGGNGLSYPFTARGNFIAFF